MRVEPGETDDNEVNGNDYVQQAWDYENENPGHQRDERLQDQHIDHHRTVSPAFLMRLQYHKGLGLEVQSVL
jgi:hypothetical protein